MKVAEQTNEDALMAAVAQGDTQAFGQLLGRWEGPVFAFLRQMLGSAEEAQDLLQDTFLKVYEQAPRYRPEGRFRSWLFRIAGNLARSRLRRRKIIRWVSFAPAYHDRAGVAPGPEEDSERADTVARVRAALDRLPVRQRQAILLRRYEDMSYREIAAAMETTVAAVQTLLHRAMTALRAELGADAPAKEERRR